LSGIEHEVDKFSRSVIKWTPGEREYGMSYVTVAFPSPEHLSNYLKQYYDGSGDDFINEQLDSIRPRKGMWGSSEGSKASEQLHGLLTRYATPCISGRSGRA
jgi:hypothetical protein